MENYERLAAENARLKAILENKGFKITYSAKTGSIVRVSRPRKPSVKYIATTWAKKKGYQSPMTMVKQITKGKAITEKKFKNAVHRAEVIKDAQQFLKENDYTIPEKFFNKIPQYVLDNTDFYENVNAILNSTTEDDGNALTDAEIRYAMKTAVYRIKRVHNLKKDPKRLTNIAKSSLGTNFQQAAMNKLTKGKTGNDDPTALSNVASEAMGVTFQGAATKKLKKKFKKLK